MTRAELRWLLRKLILIHDIYKEHIRQQYEATEELRQRGQIRH